MPLFGIVRDSPFIFLGQRLARRAGRGSISAFDKLGVSRVSRTINVNFSGATVVFRRGPLDNLLNSPRGEVGRYLFERGTRILIAAKSQVGV